MKKVDYEKWAISTHALREGRRIVSYCAPSLENISTHAPARGATRIIRQIDEIDRFLLTPLREGRP